MSINFVMQIVDTCGNIIDDIPVLQTPTDDTRKILKDISPMQAYFAWVLEYYADKEFTNEHITQIEDKVVKYIKQGYTLEYSCI